MRSLDPRETEYEYHKSGLYPNISEKSLEDLPHAGITNAKGLGIFLSTSKVQFHAESQEKKGKENLSLFIYLTLKRHWPMFALQSKKRHQSLSNFVNSNHSNLHKIHEISQMESLSWHFWGSLGGTEVPERGKNFL